MKQAQDSDMRKYVIPDIGLSLLISDALLREIEILARKYYPNEHGGLLLGSYNLDSKEANITALIKPRKFESNKMSFIRSPEGLNEIIKKAYDETNGTTIYIGEWHSHPDCPAIPSRVDKDTIHQIANDPLIMVLNPIMLIATVTPTLFASEFYIYFKNKIIHYEEHCSNNISL